MKKFKEWFLDDTEFALLTIFTFVFIASMTIGIICVLIKFFYNL